MYMTTTYFSNLAPPTSNQWEKDSQNTNSENLSRETNQLTINWN